MKAQTEAYSFKSSDEYKAPRGYDAEGDLICTSDAVFQVNKVSKKASLNIQQFSADLKFQKENALTYRIS